MQALQVTFDGVDTWVALPRSAGHRSHARQFARALPAILASSALFWSAAAYAAVRLIA